VDTTAYELMVAELLLVQTKAEDVAGVLPKVLARYPSAEKLARAQSRSLVQILRPLGLQNQRTRALRGVARALVERFEGQLPPSIHELLSLPHVGLYVGCAVACFSYGQRVPIVDANVLRVFSRIYGIKTGRELRRSPHVWKIAWRILPKRNYALHNYGVLDFAAEICKPRSPQCQICGLNRICAYAKMKKEER
jgi:A/G-specific adenine glycosylase